MKEKLREVAVKAVEWLWEKLKGNDFDIQKTREDVRGTLQEQIMEKFGVNVDEALQEMGKAEQEMVEDGFFGAIESESEFDYGAEELMAGSNLDINTLPGLEKNFFHKERKIEYNQKEVQRNSCTSEAGNTILSNTFGLELSLETRKAKWDEFVSLGADPSIGWWVHKAVDADRKIWNRDFGPSKGNVATFNIPVNSTEFWLLYKKGYMFKYGYKGNSNYSKDFIVDGIINNILPGQFGTLTYGHSIAGGRDIGGETAMIDMSNIDNYKGRKHNTYKIEEFKKKRSSLFFRTAYFYIPQSHLDMKKVEEVAQKKSTDIIAKELGLWNGENGDAPITRREAAYMHGRFAKTLMDKTFVSKMKKILDQ